MKKMVSITSQGQITIPKKKDGLIVIKPALSFADLAGSMKSDIKLTDQELKQARASFSQNWPTVAFCI